MGRNRAIPEPVQQQDPARAPYNFVPLGPVVPIAPLALPDHDTFDTSRHTGRFTVTVTNETPLFIRGAKRPEDDEAKNNPNFFSLDAASAPLLPGSSLRGMLRALVETVTFSRMSRINDRQLFYRTVEGKDASQLGNEYSRRMTGKVTAGFLVRTPGGGYGIRTAEMVRVARTLLNKHFPRLYDGSGPNQTPKWEVQHKRVWVSTVPHKTKGRVVDSLFTHATAGHQEGVLVVTGDMQKKKYEFVFLLPDASSDTIPVNDDLIKRFHDDDQLTRWQQKAFPKDKPSPRERDGMLPKALGEPGAPVFYLVENNKLTFFGRAGMFRLPYMRNPMELLPKEHQSFALYDMAEGMFGYLREKKHANGHGQGTKPRGYASRVFVMDGRVQGTYAYAGKVKAVLGAPKPTSFQLYLKQKASTGKKDLAHYDTGGAELRGRKVYWRQLRTEVNTIPRAEANQDTVATEFQPLLPGATFTFQVAFENLSDVELGALAWAVTLGGDADARHMLGMGKSFGMGVLQLNDVTLTLTDRAARYRALFDGNGWATGERTEDPAQYATMFEADMDGKLSGGSFREHESIRALTVMLRAYDADDTLFGQAALSEFKQRPVLPSPQKVVETIEAARQAVENEARQAERAREKAERAARGYQIDDVVKGKVTEASEDIVVFDVTNPLQNGRTYTGIIEADRLSGRTYQVSNDITAVVVSVEPTGPSTIDLLCRPQTREERDARRG